MNIGAIARRSGVPAKTIRYYESIGLIPSASRDCNGYRNYGASDLHRLGFIKRARGLGFSVEDVRGLLKFWQDDGRSSAAVRDLARHHLQTLDDKIEELTKMRRSVARMVDCCHGDDRSDCAILQTLSDGAHGASQPAAPR